jgi:hypothetical protein
VETFGLSSFQDSSSERGATSFEIRIANNCQVENQYLHWQVETTKYATTTREHPNDS